MDAASPRWHEITTSEFPWEREALAFVRDRLPDHEPYRAWSNFEFIADDGSINEVDLLVLAPKGFYFVEIKSAPGVVEGDAGTWTWRSDGRARTTDNPLLLADRKARKLVTLLRHQPALQHKVRAPFLEAHVFLSHPDVDCRVVDVLRDRVHLRDAGTGRDERPGIVAALTRWSAGTPPRTRLDRPVAKAVTRAMEEAGIRRSQRARRVGDYRLDELLVEGPGYQDWTAHHAAIEGERARIRIYGVPVAATDNDRARLRRAARREYQILRDVQHEGILAARTYTEHELGPALVFEHRDGSRRFDHWLAERGRHLDIDTRLDLLRQIAEALRHAHAKRLVHRALSPQSVLVVDPDALRPRIRIFNWQTAARREIDTGAAGPVTEGASRLGPLVDDAALVYLARDRLASRYLIAFAFVATHNHFVLDRGGKIFNRTAPVIKLPAEAGEDDRELVQRRIDAIERRPDLALIEQPAHKRRWNDEPWEAQQERALRGWLLDRLEAPAHWAEPRLTTAAALADRMRDDDEFLSAAALYAGRIDFDVTRLVTDLVEGESVPLLPAVRFMPSGLRKRAAWEQTWDLQRREDALDARAALPPSDPEHLTPEQAAAAKAREVGAIPVPPRYAAADYRKSSWWRLRGKLGVPKERFFSLPGCERDQDPSLVTGWAGWDALARSLAVAAWFVDRKERDGWPASRLLPLLAALRELLPWVRQHHNAPGPGHGGVRMGDYFRGFIDEERRALGLSADAIREWAPPETRRRGGRRKGGGGTDP